MKEMIFCLFKASGRVEVDKEQEGCRGEEGETNGGGRERGITKPELNFSRPERKWNEVED